MEANTGQQQAIETRGRALVVEAGAGTGKTSVLVARFIHLLEQNPEWMLDSIVAVTFTKKAAREMRTRLRESIEKKAVEAGEASVWAQRRRELERLQVGTIHGLCAHILRENAIAAGIDPQFSAIEEQQMQMLQEEAIRQALDSLVKNNDPRLALLAGLNIRDVRDELSRLISQRGTVQRLFDALGDEEQLLTQWRHGLEHMRSGLWKAQANTPEVAAALQDIPLIKITAPDDKLAEYVLAAQEGCRLLEAGDLASACKAWLPIKINAGSQGNWGGKAVLDEIKGNLKALRSAAESLEKTGCIEGIGALDEKVARELQLWKKIWDEVIATYDVLKQQIHALDFDDLELRTGELLAASPRDLRLQAYMDSINHLMVDEFQDTNEAQQRIIYAIAHPSNGEKLFVVGDAKQSIYRFRQAQVSVFNRTCGDVENITGEKAVQLNISYRTHTRLVSAVNAIFEQVLSPEDSEPQSYEAVPGSLQAFRESPGHNPAPLEILLVPSKDKADSKVSTESGRIFEAQQIAARLHALERSGFQVWDKHTRAYRPFRYSDAAVLFRATTVVPLYEEQFKTLGLPYITVSGRGYYDRPEVRDLIALLAALNNPQDDLNLVAAMRSPIFGLNDETIYRLHWFQADGTLSPTPIPYKQALATPPRTDQPEQVQSANQAFSGLWGMVGQVDVWRLVRRALDLTGYEIALALSDQSEGSGGRQHGNLLKFLDIARERSDASLSEFLQGLDDLRTIEAREGEALGSSPESGAVQIMSIHAAKGLEFPVIIVADLGRKSSNNATPMILHDPEFGIIAKTRVEGDMQATPAYLWGRWLNDRMEEAESKRLMYVAFTRAADLLILSGQMGSEKSWMSAICAVFSIEEDGEAEETLSASGYELRIMRPAYEELDTNAEKSSNTNSHAGVTDIPRLAQPLSITEQSRHFAVTHLRRNLSVEDREFFNIRPAVRRGDRISGRIRVPQYLVGRTVHRALAHWDCLSLPRVELEKFIIAFAHIEGISSPEAVSYTVQYALDILEKFCVSQLFDEIQDARERLSEVPFVFESTLGTLHGVIDLLFLDQEGNWHLLDWKTDWVRSDVLQESVQEHRQQIAVYIKAVEKILGVIPKARVCFLSLDSKTYIYTYQELEESFELLA